MADINPLTPLLTDPRQMLAMQLLQNSSDASPLRSGWQEAARAVQPLIGALLMKQGQQNQMAALKDIYGIGGSGQTAPAQSPDLLQRIGNFFTGGASSDASNIAGPASASVTSGSPQGADKTPTASPGTSGLPSPSASSSGAPVASPSVSAPSISSNPTFSGPFARQTYQAYRMIQVGQERNIPAYVNQGAQMLQNIQQEQAKASAEAVKDGKSIQWNPDGSVSVGGVNGYNEVESGIEAAKAHGGAMGKLAPDVTAGTIAQTNAVNSGTMGSEAAKAGAVSGAQAGAKNASDLAYAGPKAFATTSATNLANAGKPLTPVEINDQEQKVGENFRGSEPYKEYTQTAQGYQNVISAAKGNTKASDINMIDGLVKMFNPGATVRQATFETFLEHSQGLPDNVIGEVRALFGNGQHLSDETRAQLVAQAQNRMMASSDAYHQQATSLAEQLKAQGLNPRNVIPSFVDAYTAQQELARRQAARAATQQTPQSTIIQP